MIKIWIVFLLAFLVSVFADEIAATKEAGGGKNDEVDKHMVKIIGYLSENNLTETCHKILASANVLGNAVSTGKFEKDKTLEKFLRKLNETDRGIDEAVKFLAEKGKNKDKSLSKQRNPVKRLMKHLISFFNGGIHKVSMKKACEVTLFKQSLYKDLWDFVDSVLKWNPYYNLIYPQTRNAYLKNNINTKLPKESAANHEKLQNDNIVDKFYGGLVKELSVIYPICGSLVYGPNEKERNEASNKKLLSKVRILEMNLEKEKEKLFKKPKHNIL